MALYSSVAGPCRVPSVEMSVHVTNPTPFSAYMSISSNTSIDDSSCQPPIAIFRFRTSALRMILSPNVSRSEEHTSELQSRENLVCRLLLEKKKYKKIL